MKNSSAGSQDPSSNPFPAGPPGSAMAKGPRAKARRPGNHWDAAGPWESDGLCGGSVSFCNCHNNVMYCYSVFNLSYHADFCVG